ncbi:MAG: AAA family ATPase [Clostridia bacterium]|nr:AAA family ATPase [Clostridia bacterium]
MKNTIEESMNIPSLSVNEAVDKIHKAYCSAIKKGLGFLYLPSIMLWGPPGIGKSDFVRQLAASIERETGKKTVVTDVRLLLFNPIDLRGIPTANEDKTLAVWLKPHIFQMNPDDSVVNILFLDEISAAPQSVQAAAYQITLDRVIGEHKLPDNCIVIAAGNRVTDKSVAYKMPKALANRLCHIEITANFSSWLKWARDNGIHYKIIDFLTARRDYFMAFDPAKDEHAFPTPRTWEMASTVLNAYEGDENAALAMIAGCVGLAAATEFCMFCSVYRTLPDVEDIFEGKNPALPKSTDALFALLSSMVACAYENKDDERKIGNAIIYSEKFPPDFSVAFMKELLGMEKDYMKTLITNPAYVKWMERRGRLLNGVI